MPRPSHAVKRSTESFLDLMIDRSTRVRALEIAILANALIDPSALEIVGAIRVSPECAWLLEFVEQQPREARASFVVAVDVASRLDAAFGEFPYDETISLARDVAAVTVGELASLGRVVDLVDLANSCHHEHSRRAAA